MDTIANQVAVEEANAHGTLAIGDHVRTSNKLYAELGVGRIEQIKRGYSTVAFRPSIFGEPPYHAEIKLLGRGHPRGHETGAARGNRPRTRRHLVAVRARWRSRRAKHEAHQPAAVPRLSRRALDNYRRELATDLTLSDLERFTEKFLAAHRRQLQRKATFVEFLVPDVLARHKLRDRYRGATFERELAIKRSDAEFLALGHPFVNAMLAYVGSYDFGGLASARRIRHESLAGRSGWLFAFIVRQRISREGDDECLFRFEPILVEPSGSVDPSAALAAISAEATAGTTSIPADVDRAFQVAKEHLESQSSVRDWDDDVEFPAASWVEFV